LNKTPKTIVITGAESTGKSELTQQLAGHFNAPFVEEYARTYIEKLCRKYNYSDVEKIALFQKKQMENSKKLNSNFVFFDTWLIITKVWFEVVFNKFPDWIDKVLKTTSIDLFLICDTDLPWIADSVRENGGEKRDNLQKLYIKSLEEYNFNYKIISGKGEIRFKKAQKIVSALQ